MITRVDPEFVEESRRFRLRFTCDACVHFDGDRGQCSHGYPTAPHRGIEPSQDGHAQVVFCKEFELG
jgi:hypothetical protein